MYPIMYEINVCNVLQRVCFVYPIHSKTALCLSAFDYTLSTMTMLNIAQEIILDFRNNMVICASWVFTMPKFYSSPKHTKLFFNWINPKNIYE